MSEIGISELEAKSSRKTPGSAISQEADQNLENSKRKLHRFYIKSWNEEISKNGKATCIIATCNFTSSTVSEMEKHFKNCSATSSSKTYTCKICGAILDTTGELTKHTTLCKKTQKSKQKVSEDSHKKWENEIKAKGHASCSNQDCNFVTKNLLEIENHVQSCCGVVNSNLFYCVHCRCGFATEEDHLEHQNNCKETSKLNLNSKKVENLHFRVIKQMKNNDANEDHIIQPGPDLPTGQYRRRRAYRAEHKNSWALTLEKFKYVKCIYQNCYFIAMSLEDMITHFGYCNGDCSFAKYVCPYCNGRVTSEAILLKHIERSHNIENVTVKVETLEDKILEESNSESQDANENLESNENCNNTQDDLSQSHSEKSWEEQIAQFGYAFCKKSLCNFMASKIQYLEIHRKICDGTPEFDSFSCPKCRYRVPTSEEFTIHMSYCNEMRPHYFPIPQGEGIAESEFEENDDIELEMRPVCRQYQGKRTETQLERVSVISPTSLNSRLDKVEDSTPKPRKRGRPKKNVEKPDNISSGQVKCGKCGYQGTNSGFVHHNLKTHVGLGWIEGEEPVDMNDEKLVIRLVKEAFKLTKRAVCEKCDDVKRSVMGFISHIQNCGKSSSEKDAMKVQCPHCDGKYLKYSLGTHIKLYHSTTGNEEEDNVVNETIEVIPTEKRRSAIRAVSKFQNALDEPDDAETGIRETNYIFYEKGNERLPKLNAKLNNLWYKLKKENKEIPCRHPHCDHFSSDVKEAKSHHFMCSFLPDKVYMCEACDFYSVDESLIKSHAPIHKKYSKQKKVLDEEEVTMNEVIIKDEYEDDEEEDFDEEENDLRSGGEEEEDDEEEILDGTKKRKKKSDDKGRKKKKISTETSKTDVDIELRLRQNFCKREKLENVRGTNFYSNGLEMTLEEEMAMLKERDVWPDFHTTTHDWLDVPLQQALRYCPGMVKSVSMRFNETDWRRFERFDGDIIEDVPVLFAGGSIRSMSWCKISVKRMLEKAEKQYLAVTTARKLDHLKNIYIRSSLDISTLVQIWDCGFLENECAKEPPKFSLGIIQEGGEIWDMSWFPEDASREAEGERLKRIGLLATASEDGAIRVWSICEPQALTNNEELPVYTTEPIAILLADDAEESCFRLSVGQDGIVAGGFGNGNVAVWSLKNFSSPFSRTVGKSKIIKAHMIFQAHRTVITALTFCPLNNRYISTAGLDRFVKIWDLECAAVPVEQYNKEYSLDSVWMLNWPALIYNFDDVVANSNRGTVKFVKDILSDKHHCTFSMEDSCLSFSFSDWLNALCGGAITGEVKLRLLKNFISDQKRCQSTLSVINLEKLKENTNEGKHFPKSYDEVDLGFGLVFKDNLGADKTKSAKPKAHPEEFPIKAVNKIAFNPNFLSFTHVALGYNCGIIRIMPIKELQTSRSLQYFIEKVQKRNF